MVHVLVDAGEQAVVLDNLSTGFDWAVPPGAKLGDRRCRRSIMRRRADREHRVDAVLHFAASIVVPDSIRNSLGAAVRKL